MKYVVIIIAFLIALASMPVPAWAEDDGGVYAGVSAQPTAYQAKGKAKGSDQADGDEETEFC